ncbi:DUF1127 domain-containing protein [Methylobrevis pamukkalensis]|uniref:YjiS-like domain-containing protein n=1 Tax=Methylobrevis pamukkalensis TaxID=1439726 RepID=A0A1E3H867_9HYPH|nr:DUF1127 domain-containing protein [Methylobrevis pamukkalensis]ODN71691.1 hypothetical protein A6302_00935 [Methylobrevis pamukkalensis]
MSVTTSSSPSASGSVTALLSLTGRVVAGLRSAYLAWEDRRAVARLQAFDDAMLADIGLTRGDVYGALSLAVTERPSGHLASLAAERRAGSRAQAREIRAALRSDDATVTVDGQVLPKVPLAEQLRHLDRA